LEYCRHYIENPPASTDDKKKLELSDWDKKFCEDMEQKTLFSVILAANFLDVKPLLDCTCLYIALKLKSMTPEEIRKEYNITKEFTPEEEEKARKEFEEMILQTTSKQSSA
jgi:S-phase kinase-associated protein 1